MNKKKIANIFLLSSIIVFLIFHLFNSNNTLVYIIQKVSEAAVVGGFADWFAVSALFKHPLGLKIPHTNIIENNRQKLIQSISKTVSDVWLSKKYLALQINNIDAAEILLNLSKKQRYVKTLRKFIKKYTAKILAYTYTKQFDSILQKLVDNYVYSLDFYDIAKNSIKNLSNSSFFLDVYKALLVQTKYYLSSINSQQIVTFIMENIETDIKSKLPLMLKETFETNSDTLIDNLCDYCVWLIENNTGTITNYIEDFIENYKNKAISKEIVITLLEGFNIIDKQALSYELIQQTKHLISDVKYNKSHKIRQNIKNYILNQIDYHSLKISDYTMIFAQNILAQNIDKIKNYLISTIENKITHKTIANWIYQALNSKVASDFYKQHEFELKQYISQQIQIGIKKLINQNKTLITNKIRFEKYYSSIYAYAINQLILHQSNVNSFVKQKLIYVMRQNHHLIEKTVRNYLNDLKHDQLVSQIESKVGNDLQYIRINGSIVGSIIGLFIAIASLIIKHM